MTDQQPPQANQSGNANARVYAIAKQYDLSSKDFIQRLADYGVSVKSHMSTLDAKTLELIETKFSESVNVANIGAANEKVAKEEPTELDLDEDSDKTKNKNIETKKKVNKKKVKSKKNKQEKKDERKKEVKTEILDAEIEIEEGISVGKLATTLNKRSTEIIMQLMKLGVMANVNQSLDFEALNSISSSFDFVPVRRLTLEQINLVDEDDDPTDLIPRAPVVTIMGHVDHGKTSLLDAVRQSNVLQTEAGSITQHIGAYHVELDGGKVVFLDTPGHAAFTAMRSRGAEVTDLVVLIVAADDGIMPQTIEAISHAKAANVPIVVAINKIDVATARPDFVKQQLIEQDLMPEEWGGQTTVVEISALERLGVDDLLELILLEAELLELKDNPEK